MNIPIIRAEIPQRTTVCLRSFNAELEFIAKAVALAFGCTPEDLHTKSRRREIFWPRQIAMFLACKHTDFSAHTIADFWGLDHSTVFYARSAVESQIEVSPRARTQVEFLTNQIQGR